jgi:hypothetical protein
MQSSRSRIETTACVALCGLAACALAVCAAPSRAAAEPLPDLVLGQPGPALDPWVLPTPDRPLPLLEIPEPKEPIPPTAFLHDGFYLRFALGLSGGQPLAKPEFGDAEVQGALGPDVWIMAGGTLHQSERPSGLVLGGVEHICQTHRVETPPQEAVPSEAEESRQSVIAFGPFVDWYFDVEGGWHTGAFVAVGVLSQDDDADTPMNGPAVGAFGGYDFWVAEQWSLGLGASGQFTRLRGSGQKLDLGTAALSLQIVYH